MATKTSDYDRYLELHKQASDVKQPFYEREIFLIRKITGHDWGNGLEEALGDLWQGYSVVSSLEEQIDYDVLRKHWNYSKGSVQDDSSEVDWSSSCDELNDYIKKVENMRKISDVKIMILEKKVVEMEKQSMEKPHEMSSLVQEIHAEVEKLHSKELTKNHSVYHLYNDGEITSQKGGDIYLMRTEHNWVSSLPIPKSTFTFPIEARNGFTYAILTEPDARRIRDKMSQLK